MSRFGTFAQKLHAFNVSAFAHEKPMQGSKIDVTEQIDTPDPRRDALRGWLNGRADFAGLSLEPASGDASFRRYFRLDTGERTFIAMDAPPDLEDSRPFVEIAGLLQGVGLNVPNIVDADYEQGFVLMSDLGVRQYLTELEKDAAAADALYRDAMSTLRRLQGIDRTAADLPSYDATLLRRELALFHDWLCEGELGLTWDRTAEQRWDEVAEFLVATALQQPQVFVHRDYHSRNLMVCEDNPGVLDFQDAVWGPLTYDVVSLLRDCYIRWPDSKVREWARDFYQRLDIEVAEDDYWRWFDTMGVQRHLKAAGIFARLARRDGKTGYLGDVPRTLGYVVDVAGRYSELEFLASFVSERCLPQLVAAK